VNARQLVVLKRTHRHNVGAERVGSAEERCDHSIKVKKPFRRLLLESVHPDCRLSELRFDFHSMRVSGEKTALVQIAPPRTRPSARISSEHHNVFGEYSASLRGSQ
jgi:hypothetical protein